MRSSCNLTGGTPTPGSSVTTSHLSVGRINSDYDRFLQVTFVLLNVVIQGHTKGRFTPGLLRDAVMTKSARVRPIDMRLPGKGLLTITQPDAVRPLNRDIFTVNHACNP